MASSSPRLLHSNEIRPPEGAASSVRIMLIIGVTPLPAATMTTSCAAAGSVWNDPDGPRSDSRSPARRVWTWVENRPSSTRLTVTSSRAAPGADDAE